jgi:hypothetical protein
MEILPHHHSDNSLPQSAQGLRYLFISGEFESRSRLSASIHHFCLSPNAKDGHYRPLGAAIFLWRYSSRLSHPSVMDGGKWSAPLYPGETVPGTRCVEKYVGPRTAVAKKIIDLSQRISLSPPRQHLVMVFSPCRSHLTSLGQAN